MAKQGQTANQNLDGLTDAAGPCRDKGLPPVHMWNPPFCGDLDMRIATDGTWFYLGTPIGRPALVRLFSTILKREDDKYFFVTPVEKVGIRVDDAPFLAVEMGRKMRRAGGRCASGPVWTIGSLRFGASVAVEAAADGGLTPYLHVRSELWAKVTRALYYDLVEIGEERVVDGRECSGSCQRVCSFRWPTRRRRGKRFERTDVTTAPAAADIGSSSSSAGPARGCGSDPRA